jgi:hypothetical protein
VEAAAEVCSGGYLLTIDPIQLITRYSRFVRTFRHHGDIQIHLNGLMTISLCMVLLVSATERLTMLPSHGLPLQDIVVLNLANAYVWGIAVVASRK